ncbi:hypothetical protein [Paenarthrobacter sp. C1]|uniref:hypothetical protein n=1 Tax=Paenarthrobacter sp. C1 TaxID=3400220 RepID=UPI003BF49750
MGKVKALNISRREFRGLLAENYGKPGEPGGHPWFGEGRFVQHLAVDINVMVAFCGRDLLSINSHPIRTLIGVTCPGSVRVLKRINRRIDAENQAAE